MELFASFLFGTVGAAYFLYGKRQSEITFMLAGGMLAFYPYFVEGAFATVTVGLLLSAAPFVARRFGI